MKLILNKVYIMEKLLEDILEELKNISELESQGPDGDVLFEKLDAIINEMGQISSTLEKIDNRVETLEYDISRIAENTDN